MSLKPVGKIETFDHRSVCEHILQLTRDVAQIKEQTMPNPVREIGLFMMGGALFGMVLGYIWKRR